MQERILANRPSSQSGFALVLALLSLVLMTFLGITLSITTSSESQISSNYNWARQAYYNAVGGSEIAKNFLAGVDDWGIYLPAARTTRPFSGPPPWGATSAHPDTSRRDFEGATCDTGPNGGYQGYGVVLQPKLLDYAGTYMGQMINGAFTVWVRRATTIDANQNVIDDTSNTSLVLTVEGVAPSLGRMNANGLGFGNAAGNVRRQTQAVAMIELSINHSSRGCDPQYGQYGGGASGANYSCTTLGDNPLPGATDKKTGE